MASFWTPERIQRVRDMAAKGRSMSEVADRLGCTRSAIAGIAFRHDIVFECSGKHLSDIYSAAQKRAWASDDGTRRSAAAEQARRTFLGKRRVGFRGALA